MTNELRRQAIHVGGGLLLAIAAAFVSKTVFLIFVGSLFALGCVFLWVLPRYYKHYFGAVERENAAFLGKGAVFFGLGVLCTAILFYEHAGLAILILTVADAASTLFGAAFPTHKLPYNKRKTLTGSAAFFVAASLILSVQYQELAIFFIAFLLTALESFDYREIPFLDDNLVIPVVGAYLLTFL